MKRLIIGLITGAVLVMLLLVFVFWAKAPPSMLPPPAPLMPAEITMVEVPPPGQEEVYKADVLLPTAEKRMIVRTGEMSLVVDDVVEARKERRGNRESIPGTSGKSRGCGGHCQHL